MALFSALSFILVGLSLSVSLVIFGVVCASISAGLGEISFLSFTAHYDKSTVSGWASGTGQSSTLGPPTHLISPYPPGAAGIGGALIYAGLRTFLSAKVTLLLQLFMPTLLILTYIFILTKPAKVLPGSRAEDSTPQTSSSTHRRLKFKFFNKKETKYFISHLKYIPRLVKYMIPLFCVYIAEYMINQGLFEVLYYSNTRLGAICLDQKDQYRWFVHDVIPIYCTLIGCLSGRYQVVYQLGVFISRSSVSVIHITWFWVLAVLQVLLTVL